MLVEILLPLPELKKFGYVLSCGLFPMLYSLLNPVPPPGPH